MERCVLKMGTNFDAARSHYTKKKKLVPSHVKCRLLLGNVEKWCEISHLAPWHIGLLNSFEY